MSLVPNVSVMLATADCSVAAVVIVKSSHLSLHDVIRVVYFSTVAVTSSVVWSKLTTMII